ncbi:hypothetical protein [Streptomyces sp. NPDC059278]|uniref:restriction system modified-DNA reader domain-containing protein n=1 Tax=Streptomyces sp. NPDC059278 TaxID=3346801 RepID=UPI0036903D78
MRAAELNKLVDACGADKVKLAKHLDSAHWRKLRPALVALHGRKCWYCEGKITNSRPHIDHFRPTRKVTEDPSHSGYYWLAFEPSNFRLSCEFCNSSTDDAPTGKRDTKHNHFPLLNESARIKSAGLDIRRELPVLLDPVIESDCDLLSFDSTGKALRNGLKTPSPLESVDRVKESIRIYGLDRPGLDVARKQVMSDLMMMADFLESGAPIAASRIRLMISPSSEHSSAALSALRMQRAMPSIVQNFGEEMGVNDSDARSSQTAAVTTLLDLIHSSIVKPGIELIGTASFGEVTAVLLPDGRLEVGARAYSGPDSAAAAAAGAAGVNGWLFWCVEVNNGRVTLAQIRDAHPSA